MIERWYTAECVYKSIHIGEEPTHEKLGEYRIFLIRAEDDEHALEKALSVAKQREHSFQNTYGATVNWVLESVINVVEVIDGDLRDGCEIYYKFFSGAGGSGLKAEN